MKEKGLDVTLCYVMSCHMCDGIGSGVMLYVVM